MSATPTVLRFGQLVIGPPGSGKSTYCRAMKEFLTALGRKVVIVNLDPANEALPYECSLDVSELITLQDVMDRLHLGPNGSLIYCMEYLEKNLEWLKSRLDAFKEQHYFLFDCPGQVELYTHHCSVRNVAQQLEKWKFKLVAVHLVDSHHCVDPGKFVSILFTSLSTMVQIELPHINLLSKVDLMEQYGKLAFGLDYYTEVLDLRYLLELMSDEPFFHKYRKLNEALITLVEDYSLVSFLPLTVQEKESMAIVVKAVDKAGGYMYGHADGSSMSSLVSAYYGAEYDYERTGSMKEKFFSMDTSPKN